MHLKVIHFNSVMQIYRKKKTITMLRQNYNLPLSFIIQEIPGKI